MRRARDVASGGERFADEGDRRIEVAGDEPCWDATKWQAQAAGAQR